MPRLTEILEELEIVHYDEELFELGYTQLRDLFQYATTSTVDTTRLIRNLIWQDYQRIKAGELMLEFGNIRSYWYARVKPVLSRARAKKYAEKYDSMIAQFVDVVLEHHLFNYGDFGFTDENADHRLLGKANQHIWLIAEKTGHWPILQMLHRDYDCTIVALGGQPSALSTEYLLAELAGTGFVPHPDEPTPLFTIVDYDPAGDSIANSFMRQAKALGFDGEFERIDLAHPSRMTHKQIRLHRSKLKGGQTTKNDNWIERGGGLEAYGFGKKYGLSADAMSWIELLEAFDEAVVPYLKTPRELVVRRRLKFDLVEVMRELLLQRLLG